MNEVLRMIVIEFSLKLLWTRFQVKSSEVNRIIH